MFGRRKNQHVVRPFSHNKHQLGHIKITGSLTQVRSSLVLKYLSRKKPVKELARLKKKLQCVAAASKQMTRKWCLFAILTSCRARTSTFTSYDHIMERRTLYWQRFWKKIIYYILSSGCSCENHNSSLKSVYSRSGFCISVASSYNTMGQWNKLKSSSLQSSQTKI